MIKAQAPGKVILTGEHAVVYGVPALASPFSGCQAKVTIEELNSKEPIKVYLSAPQLNLEITWSTDQKTENPLLICLKNFLEFFNQKLNHSIKITILSTIPIASGMGSGAAISTAINKALAKYFSVSPSEDQIENLVMETEKIYHGNPSGLDAKIIIGEKALLYRRGKGTTEIKADLEQLPLLIIDSGIRSSTKDVVSQVRSDYEKNQTEYKEIFKLIGELSLKASKLLEEKNYQSLGKVFNQNQNLLRKVNVSHPEIEKIIQLIKNDVWGIKLSGAGQGGIVIAVYDHDNKEKISQNLKEANYQFFYLN